MSTGLAFFGSRSSAGRRKPPQDGQRDPLADRLAVEMMTGIAVDSEVGELQFEGGEVRDQGGIPVVVAVPVDLFETVVADAARDCKTLPEGVSSRYFHRPGAAYPVTG